MNKEQAETLKGNKLLGTFITDDLKWDENTTEIVREKNQDNTTAFQNSKHERNLIKFSCINFDIQ